MNNILAAIGWAYLGLLLGWLFAYLLIGDRSAFLGLSAILAVYFFVPVPLVAAAALLVRSRSLAVGAALCVLAFLWLWGGLYIPRFRRFEHSPPRLTVMTFNVLAWHNQTAPILSTIRGEDPDIVFIQELNTNLADTFGRELAETYPYQVLDPADNPIGIGTLSKFPIRLTGEQVPLQWIGGPQIMELSWQGSTYTLINFHMVPTSQVSPRASVERSFMIREAEANLLAELARRSGPLIMGGDANSVPLHRSYHILTHDLSDAWVEAGFGLGHTFPGRGRVRVGQGYAPPWLARIDYLFHSKEWETVEAHQAADSGVSDHRGVVAVFQLKDNGRPTEQP